jgi:hypothetical protein
MRPLAHAVLCLLELAHARRGLLLAADQPAPAAEQHEDRMRSHGENHRRIAGRPHAQIELAGRRLVSLLACGVSVRHAGADESRRRLQDVWREIKDSENLCVRENY